MSNDGNPTVGDATAMANGNPAPPRIEHEIFVNMTPKHFYGFCS